MTKILVCLSNAIWCEDQFKVVCFYEQLLESLKEAGNDVRVFIPNYFNTYTFQTDNQLKAEVDEQQLRKDILDFNPDLILSFNYATYHSLLDITNCPVVIWNSDFVALWNQVEAIKNNLDRFTFFCFGEPGKSDLVENFPKISPKQMHVVKPATGLKPSNIPQDKNISFIGFLFEIPELYSNFLNNLTLSEKKLFSNVLAEGKNLDPNDFLNNQDNITELDQFKSYVANNCPNILTYIATEKRVSEVFALSDLGLTLHGVGWERLAAIYPSLALLFDKKLVYSAKHNQDIYNASKICLNSMHPQASDGIAWRVLDIMATNGCLLSEHSLSIKKIFGNYKLPMYTNPYEARELCIKLLKEDNLRADIVAKSQEIVEANFTWEKRFAEIQEILNIKLIHNQEGSLQTLQPHYHKHKIYKETLPIKVTQKLQRISYFSKALISEIFFIPKIKKLLGKDQ